ncbi:hypothetical protein [Aureispira anguillae]|uniref:Uncharacterized protein n=1 Tax=Aureispira anguillae TaxID=2864201 RepID=A0A915YJ87_9BACT|nr:hypothetical protein [Aureispira anguillae]BDS14002.1 hypothetical protein AsAng_0047650 [Aureispira anguillae]
MAKIRKNKKGAFPKIQLNLLAQFQELLNFEVKHDFFRTGVFPKGKVSLKPTEETLKELSRHRLQYRSMPSGFMLGYASTDSYTPVKDIKKPIHLSFLLDVADIKFLNYTDLPFEFEEDTMFYFNNKSLEKEDTEHKNLSLNQYVTAEDKVDICGFLFNYDFDEEQYGTEVQVMNVFDEIVFEEILEDGIDTCEISLVGQPEGKYSILVDGLEEKSFYLYNGLKTLFGIIDIFIDKDDFGEYAFFDDDGEVVVQDYNIHFGNRSVRWQYLLIENGNNQMYKDHEIYDTTKKEGYEPMLFEAAEAGTIDGGKEIFSIWTSEPIKFREQQQEKFKLKTKRGKSGVEWIVQLPCASALGNLKVNLSDKSEVYSELIVYL